MNFLRDRLTYILFWDISFLEDLTRKFFIGVILYFAIYLLIYLFLSKLLKINRVTKGLFFSWVFIRPLVLLYLIILTISG